MKYNVYCDESCHLEYDGNKVMVLGAIWCPDEKKKNISENIAKLKEKHHAKGELKWTKVSLSRKPFYEELIDYFKIEDDLHYRVVVIKNKDKLDHDKYNEGSHDTFYYKMYYFVLKQIFRTSNQYSVYLDIKDTKSRQKLKLLKEILQNKFGSRYHVIENFQHIRSHESQIMQLTDFFTGAVGYKLRFGYIKSTKEDLCYKIQNELHIRFGQTTSNSESKFSILVFDPEEHR